MMLKHATRVPPIVPYITSLPDGREVVVDFMTDEQISKTYAMIQEAAKAGDGFGINEFKNEQTFKKDVEDGKYFGITEKDGGDLIAAFVIAISKFYRGSKVADPIIIVKKCERRKGVGEFCLRSALSHATELNFIGMYVDCFSDNKGMIKIIENIGGFKRCGFLPMGGQVSDKTFVGTLIFYKDFKQEE